MNKVRKLAEDMIEKHPDDFGTDFNANKKALDRYVAIRNRVFRNQVAGTLTVIMRERAPDPEQESEEQERQPENVYSEGAEVARPEEMDQSAPVESAAGEQVQTSPA